MCFGAGSSGFAFVVNCVCVLSFEGLWVLEVSAFCACNDVSAKIGDWEYRFFLRSGGLDGEWGGGMWQCPVG